ncbi:hypothetical protein SEUCBS139899_006394 [Sporothrix eucalyptigena]|uniref:Methyltransferase domain-containing protein n=1 Tax=Sporothrix eucalyptigena TaxID=1812306 RepID=A0ABP0BCS5_9PEZI
MDDSSDFIEPASAHDDDSSLHVHDADFHAVTSDYDPTLHERNESLVGSVTSSVNEHIYENGRRYHKYKSGRYPIPNDDKEASRETVRNALFQELLGGRLHLSPIGDAPHNIMDIGTGFGDWAIDMADRYPSARVVGLDLSPIQSVWIPPNVEFVVDDVEDNAWIHGSDYDLVHLRMMAVILKSPATVAATAFQHIKPGGWIEFHEVYPRIGCHDDTMPDDYVVGRFYRLVARELQRQHGWDLYAAEHLPAQLEQIGFVNIQRKVCHVPIGYWPKDPHRMQHAFLFEETLAEFIAAMLAKPLNTRVHDIASLETGEILTAQDIDALCAEVQAALCARNVHAYIPFHFVWAQKPI